MCERECAKCQIMQENSAFTEVMHEMLVSELKADLFSSKVKSEEQDYESEENSNEVIANNRMNNVTLKT